MRAALPLPVMRWQRAMRSSSDCFQVNAFTIGNTIQASSIAPTPQPIKQMAAPRA